MSFLDNPQLVYNWASTYVVKHQFEATGARTLSYVVDGERHNLYVGIEHGHGDLQSSFMADHRLFTVRVEKPKLFRFKATYESIHDSGAWSFDLPLITDKYATKKFHKPFFWWIKRDFNNTLDHHLMILTLLISDIK